MSFTPSLSNLKKNWLTVCALHFEVVYTSLCYCDIPAVYTLHFEVVHTFAEPMPSKEMAVCALHFEVIYTV